MKIELQKQKDREKKLRKIEGRRRIKGKNRHAVKVKKIRLLKEKKAEAGTKEKIVKNLAGRSRDFKKCFNLLESARKEIIINKNRAKELYAKAREVYVGLEYHEKKEVYKELVELYNKLLK